VLDARDIEEVIFVIVCQEAFHLRRVHAAVGLGDIDGRNSQRWEDVAGRFTKSEERTQDDGGDEDKHRERPTHGRADYVHGFGIVALLVCLGTGYLTEVLVVARAALTALAKSFAGPFEANVSMARAMTKRIFDNVCFMNQSFQVCSVAIPITSI